MNLNYLFYHKYFDFLLDDVNAPKPADINQAIWRATVKDTMQEESLGEKFYMKTTYPGLLVGIGNAHDAAEMMRAEEDNKDMEQTIAIAKDAIKIGFTLDYVTGLPIIPGSTVKGILRCAFSNYPDYVREKLAEITRDSKWLQISVKHELKDLENLMFGDNNNVNIGAQDIFFDAIPVAICGSQVCDTANEDYKKSSDEKAPNGKRILGEDFVTSHRSIGKDWEKYDGLVEPNAVRMLKVLPNVVFAFRFIGQDTKVGEFCLSCENKKALFAGIIEDLGIGAKTNLGYGNMVCVDVSKVDEIKSENQVLEIENVTIKKAENKQEEKVKQKKNGRV